MEENEESMVLMDLPSSKGCSQTNDSYWKRQREQIDMFLEKLLADQRVEKDQVFIPDITSKVKANCQEVQREPNSPVPPLLVSGAFLPPFRADKNTSSWLQPVLASKDIDVMAKECIETSTFTSNVKSKVSKIIVPLKDPNPLRTPTPSQSKEKAVRLTDEEKSLFNSENLPLPQFYPLSRTDEVNLKRIRRKIKNKNCAKESRRKKKEYIDSLLERIREFEDENRRLMLKLKQSMEENDKLSFQLRKHSQKQLNLLSTI
ncbi:cyclic AMP response element-binding protein A-like isoform X1 [Artemia franciscana]|uniref:cyclic AMP response element-binding protein A-like isoform X1 n=2 Tax=Artemia franciscana TaxID=6661 RepID=UPI0032DA1B51